MPIKTTGISKVNRKLNQLKKLNRGLIPTMRNIAQRGEDIMATYPPTPAGSKYIRTGSYGASVGSEVRASGNGVQAMIFSRGVSYAQWLKDPQADHMGHWNHLSDDAVRLRGYAVGEVRNYVQRAIR